MSKLVGWVQAWVLWFSLRRKVSPEDGRSPDPVREVKAERSNWMREWPRLDEPRLPMAPEIGGDLKTWSSSEAPTFEAVSLAALGRMYSLVIQVSLVGRMR